MQGLETAVIKVTREEATAPAGMLFSLRFTTPVTASDPNFDAYSDLHYTWDFGDPGWYTRHDTEDLPWGRYYAVEGQLVGPVSDGPAPEGRDVRFLGNDSNIAYGPHAAHVFAPERDAFGEETYRDFEIRCEIRSRPGSEPDHVVRRTVRIYDPDARFWGNRTLLISAEGDLRNPRDPAWAGPHPSNLRFNTLRDAMQHLRKAPPGAGRARILFRRGETHSAEANWGKRAGKKFAYLQAGAYGEGSDPVVTGQSGFDLDPKTEVAFWGLALIGPYDAGDPYSARRRPNNGLGLGYADHTTVWDCHVTGFNNCLIGGGANVIIGNCLVTSWSNYGIYMAELTKHHGQCGVWLKQKADAVISEGRDEKSPPIYADHGPFRCTAFSGPSAFNLIDYRGLGSWAGTNQPTMRLGRVGQSNNTDNPKYIEEVVVDRFRSENGTIRSPIVHTRHNEGRYRGPALPRRYIYDKIYQVMPNQDGVAIVLGTPGAVVRNAILVFADVPSFNPPEPRSFIEGSFNVIYDPLCAEYGLAIYSNSFIDLRSDRNLDDAGWYGFIRKDTLKADRFLITDNNVEHAPNRRDVATDAGPFEDRVLWPVTIDGIRYGEDPFRALYAFPADTARTFRPLPRAPGYRNAEGRTAIDDFFGTLRPSTPSRGAVEPG